MNTRRPMENPPSPGDRAGWVRWRYAQDQAMLAEWAAAWAKIPSGVRAEITALHERYQYDCTGFNEGLWWPPAYAPPRLGITGAVETIGWVIILGHVVHWAVDALYYLTTQVSYLTVAKHGTPVTVIGSQQPGDWWDRLPVHLVNLLGWNPLGWVNNGPAAPLWWVTGRHDTRYVVIGVIAGVALTFLVSKPPRQRRDYRWYRVAATPVLALLLALPGVAAGALLIWKVPYLQVGGITAPASWGIFGHEVTQWSGSGKLALLALGLLGSQLFAKYASKGPADEAQWLYAAQRANKILRQRTGALAGLGTLADAVVIGPPGYRARVRYLVAQGTVTATGDAAMTVTLWLLMAATLVLAGYGAWLTLAGPAAGA